MKRLACIAAVVLGMGLGVTSVLAQGPSVVARFNPGARELPEGVAVDREGNLYLSMQSGEIKRVTSAGAVSSYARVPSPGQGFITGLAFDQRGDLYVCISSFDPATHGIWRVRRGGSVERFASLDTAGLPNGPAFDKQGNLYVSDSFLGQIWKLDAQGRVGVWKADPLLKGVPDPGPPLGISVGANGIAFDAQGAYLYVANTDFGRILRIPVRADGSAGSPQLFVEDPALLGGADGIAFDNQGNLYVAVFGQDRLVIISSSGTATTLAQGGPLQNPSSLAFGEWDQARELFVANFAVLRALGAMPGTPAPALLKIPVGNPGLPLPYVAAPGPAITRLLVYQRVELLPQVPLCWDVRRGSLAPENKSPATGQHAHGLTLTQVIAGTERLSYGSGPTLVIGPGQGVFTGNNNWHVHESVETTPRTNVNFELTCQRQPGSLGNTGVLPGRTGPLARALGPHVVTFLEVRGRPGSQTSLQAAAGPLTAYFLEGAVALSTPAGVTQHRAGDTLVIPPGTPFQTTTVGDAPARALVALLTPAGEPATRPRPDVRLPSVAPAALPRTGDTLPWAGPAALLAGLVLLVAGFGLRRVRA